MNSFKYLFFSLGFIIALSTGCSLIQGGEGSVNLFTLEQDKELGAQLEADIASKPSEYPLLDEQKYATAYKYLIDMRNEILASPEVKYKNEFLWKLKIVHDDDVLNAFCAPGGYIYVYTGLMKYLDKVDHLAGVLAHEIAHADQRHSTASMTKKYGLDVLVAVASRNATAGQISQIAGSLTQLGFSRGHETDADDHSVDYLKDTKYACNGAAGFFEKLEAQGQSSSTPAFLSTHPSPGNRIAKINERATEKGCSKTFFHDNGDNGAYAAMLKTLP